jgi:hypothetical protein
MIAVESLGLVSQWHSAVREVFVEDMTYEDDNDAGREISGLVMHVQGCVEDGP